MGEYGVVDTSPRNEEEGYYHTAKHRDEVKDGEDISGTYDASML